MRGVMFRLLLLIVALLVVIVILILLWIFKLVGSKERREISPLERGLSTVSKTYTILSLQYFIILIIFLILDLEILFVIAFIFGGHVRLLLGRGFWRFIIITLWLEWRWGKLSWAVLQRGVLHVRLWAGWEVCNIRLGVSALLTLV